MAKNARDGDPNETYSKWRPYPTFSIDNQTKGKTESPNTAKADKPATTERGMIDKLKQMP